TVFPTVETALQNLSRQVPAYPGKSRIYLAAARGNISLPFIWLHASELALPHPATGAPLRLSAPLGDEWACWSQAASQT
ncbi:MAG: hypothetical protein ACK5M8_22290, partial [Shewanella algae]